MSKMYLTTTLASLPATSSNFSSLQTISLQRKPLPPIPIQQRQVQQAQYIQSRDQQQYSSRTQQQKSNMQYYTEHHQQSSSSNNSIKNSSIISQDVSLLEQVAPERAFEFAAHMTCFLWFGDYLMDSHNTTSSIIAPPPPPGGNGHGRYTEYKPRDAFKKFCKDVISATQVSNSVILLSLLYIHRMKINNPSIKGQNGSEYRTFTVALMLANKFLDDNTYTNKTWSEVTNIPVSEINTMEMEFLSSLDYELYVSEQQYFEWVRKTNSYVAFSDDKKKHDDNKASDCAMAVPQQQVTYSSQQSYMTTQQQQSSSSQQSQQSQSNQSNQSNQRQILVPAMTTGFKRSAEQAFVDGIMVSPPKRTNLYPVYAASQQQLVVQSSQPQYTQAIAYPTPPSSTGGSQVTYYNLPATTSSSSSVVYTSRPQQSSYSVRSTQAQYSYPINSVYITARRMQSNLNLINTRSGPSGFPINLSFPTTVV